MKRILALLLAALLVIGGLVACGDTTVDPGEDTAGNVTDPDVTDPKDTEPDVTEPDITEPEETDPPEPQIEIREDAYDRVVIFCISGAGTFIKKADTPNIDSIFENGVMSYKLKAEIPTYTPQNIGSMLHGVTYENHRISDSLIEDYTYFHDSDFPSVFRVARAAYPDATLASFSTYGDISTGVIEADIGVHADTADTDAALAEKVVSYLGENDPKLLFVQFNEVDDEGPISGYGGSAYIEKIGATDGYIGQIYDALVAEGLTENTLFIITSDHGGNGKYRGHDTSMEVSATFGITGKDINTECKIKSMEMRDVAAVITYGLGLEQPQSWTAMIPNGLFTGLETTERPTGEIPEEPDTVVELDTSALLDDSDGTDIYDRVIIIGIDGGGAFFKDADTPYINAIFGTGALSFTTNTVLPSISAHSWTSLMHGVTPDIHGITNSIAASDPYPTDSPYPSIFRLAREAYPDAALASFCTWDTINEGIVEENIGVHKDTADDDAALTEKILAYLDENDPKLMYIQFDNVDGMGHNTGFGSEWQRYQIEITDGYIGQIYNKLLEEGLLKNTLFIITPDHGGTPYSYASHGGDTEAELNIMYGVAGKTVIQGGTITSLDEEGNPAPAKILDTAAIVAYALGFEAPDTWTATVPGDLFEGIEATVRPTHTIIYDVDHRDNESVPTPEAGSGSYITDVLGDRVISYLTLDGNTADAMGKTTAESGELEYIDGFYGNAINVESGSVEIEGFAPGTDSFSVAFWFKTPLGKFDEVTDPCILANKNWSGGDAGFVMYLFYDFHSSTDYNDYYMGFNLGDGSNRMDVSAKMPSDWQDGWVHVILSVDRAAGTVGISYDFGEYTTFEIPEELKNASFDGINGLILGQDSSKEYESLPASFDEVLIVKGAMTADDVAALAAHYGVK